MTAQIKLEREAHIAKLTISNPPANTWTLESLNQQKSWRLNSVMIAPFMRWY